MTVHVLLCGIQFITNLMKFLANGGNGNIPMEIRVCTGFGILEKFVLIISMFSRGRKSFEIHLAVNIFMNSYGKGHCQPV